MKKLILNLGLILGLAGSVGIAEGAELKECKSEKDKMSGCVEKEYGENENFQWEVPYKNGKQEGIVKMYYPNGNLMHEIPYKNDKIEGVGKAYYENGNLLGEIPYKNDKKEGVTKLYYANGDLVASLTYKNDKPISGECGNGKVFTAAHLHNIDRDTNNINDICNN